MSFFHDEFFRDTPTFREIRDRAGRVLTIFEGRSESNILVITHGFFLRTLFAHTVFGPSMRPEDFRKFTLAVPGTKNTHVTVFHYREDRPAHPWRIWIWNDHAHLG